MTEIIHDDIQFMITKDETESRHVFRFWRLEEEVCLLDDSQVEDRIEELRRSLGKAINNG